MLVAHPSPYTDILSIPGLRELWTDTLGDSRVFIAVLDGPVDLTHPSLHGANLTQIESFGSEVNARGQAAEHGLHVASIIFGAHDGPVKGVAPLCRGIIVPVFKDGEDGSVVPCSQLDLARAITQTIEFADKENAHALVINISGGQFTPSGAAHPILADAIRNCDKDKVLIVAAAGNQGCDCLHIPGAIPAVLPVGAMTLQGSPLDFSNWGDVYRERGILAPGENILGALPSGGTTAKSGTSFATPIVSGIGALLLSAMLKRGKAATAQKVRQGILQAALGCEYEAVTDCRKLLAGRLNIPGAISIITQGDRNMADSIDIAATDKDMPMRQSPPIQPQAATDGLSPQNLLPTDQRTTETGSQSMMMPSDCGCGGGKKAGATAPQKVFALGKLFYDYGTRSRRVYFANKMKDAKLKDSKGKHVTDNPDIDDPANLHQYLTQRPDIKPVPDYQILNGPQFSHRTDVTALQWILKIDETPIYAIVPMGPFAFEIHDTLVEFLQDTYKDGAERISVPGIVVGEIRLFTGETVPAIQPDPRGMFSWKRSLLVAKAADAANASGPARDELDDFLLRVYDQTRNLGISSPERAVNFAATDALMLQFIFKQVLESPKFKNMELDSFTVGKSPICRPDFDCWDVTLIFYDPNNLQRARRAKQFTVDVSDVMPVMLTIPPREFSLR